MNPLLRIIALSIMLLGSCDRSASFTGRSGEIQSGDTRIRYYVDNGTEDEAQRVALVMGRSIALGLAAHEVSWERPQEGESRTSVVEAGEAVWIVWEDNTVQSIGVAPKDVSTMIASWSDGQPVPVELAEIIQEERSRQGDTQ